MLGPAFAPPLLPGNIGLGIPLVGLHGPTRGTSGESCVSPEANSPSRGSSRPTQLAFWWGGGGGLFLNSTIGVIRRYPSLCVPHTSLSVVIRRIVFFRLFWQNSSVVIRRYPFFVHFSISVVILFYPSLSVGRMRQTPYSNSCPLSAHWLLHWLLLDTQ